ncbi:glycosyltransferase family 4 protein [Leptothoe sp. PORK10 BA2]|uniref:glycosyltransferase family 4 protein n=1 Tax=Leptothoe sp. PORK10 BA2 TaxID=3110254 RepID=UPI002B1F0CEB|nr:glycosyltransferase family 4 protein [Leptothoe sp. PORK10 BA2]MEA5464547.1 glycosyltransferase family 4 protein [Leptothoe sp. PORK10 BA2]
MKWSVIAAYFNQEHVDKKLWLCSHISNEKYDFELIARSTPITNWHDRKLKFTTPSQWLLHWNHAAAALNSDADGVITLFPQLPAVIGWQKLLRRSKKPIVAWTFNIGNYQVGPIRLWMARCGLRQIDRFVVHSRQEIEIYSNWLNIPESRFEFVPFPCSGIDARFEENTENPFVAALGSAHRDFPCLFQAVKELNLPTVVAAGRSALEGITIPEQVKTPFGISRLDCYQIAQESRINVVPLEPKPDVTAAGHVTVIEAMHMRQALIVSDCYRMSDYVQHGETGLLVKPGCVESLKEAIMLLWNDPELRNRLGRNAQAYAQKHFSDEGAARCLERILDDVTGRNATVTPSSLPSSGAAVSSEG